MRKDSILLFTVLVFIHLTNSVFGQSRDEINVSIQTGQITSKRIDPAQTVVPAANQAYPINPQTKIGFKAGAPVKFYKTGFVAAGTLAENTALYYNGGAKVSLKAGTEVWFFETSFVWRGTLVANAAFPINPKDSASRSADSVVVFNNEGFLVP